MKFKEIVTSRMKFILILSLLIIFLFNEPSTLTVSMGSSSLKNLQRILTSLSINHYTTNFNSVSIRFNLFSILKHNTNILFDQKCISKKKKKISNYNFYNYIILLILFNSLLFFHRNNDTQIAIFIFSIHISPFSFYIYIYIYSIL